MKFRKVFSAFACCAFAGSAVAENIIGQVKDEQGNAVSGAKITIEGSTRFVITNEEGMYRIENVSGEHVHLHVYSVDHVHGDTALSLSGNDEDTVANFTLRATRVENVLVMSNSLASSVLESTTPISVLSDQDLRQALSPTLGETLISLPGVHTSSFGSASSSPIIRGADGPRVKIVQNGLDVSDASRVGPDHNVGAEASTATQIEVLRGPSTLQFGSGAIGGVVNVVDQRIANELPQEVNGAIDGRFNSVSDEKLISANVSAAIGSTAIYADVFSRDSDDYEIPGHAEANHDETLDEEEEGGVLENSGMEASGGSLGVSFIGNSGYFGVAVQTLENLYGVPGHAHHEEAAPVDPTAEEEFVMIDVDLTRVQVAGEWYSPIEHLSAIKWRFANTDYKHVELEGDEIGTTFKNTSYENRISIQHEALNNWHGVLGIHHSHSEFSAIGEEAYMPSNTSKQLALYFVEETEIGNTTYQLGGRYEKVRLDADESVTLSIDPAEIPEQTFTVDSQSFSSASFSTGAIWRYSESQHLAPSYTFAQRAPSHQEFFSAGEHISTSTYDLGLAFDIDENGNIRLSDKLQKETSNNVDITWRFHDENIDASISLFLNHVNNYIYQRNTGLVAHHDEAPVDPLAMDEGIAVYEFAQEDALLRGMEFDVNFQLNKMFGVSIWGDTISAKLDNEYLPRIPPMRIGTALQFNHGDWSGKLDVNWYDKQNKLAENETESDAYSVVNIHFEYTLSSGSDEWAIYFAGKNLLDEEIRPHTSFIKDEAPLQGRGVVVGLSYTF